MNRRNDHTKITDADEQSEVERLRTLIGQPGAEKSPPDLYWSNLLIRTNQRIDSATSGKALSLSWAFRVALPGVVAILAFFIGLQYYYVSNAPKDDASLAVAVLSTSDDAVDSLASRILPVDELVGVRGDLLEPTSEQLIEYYLGTGGTNNVLETLSNDQVTDIIAKLASRKTTI